MPPGLGGIFGKKDAMKGGLRPPFLMGAKRQACQDAAAIRASMSFKAYSRASAFCSSIL